MLSRFETWPGSAGVDVCERNGRRDLGCWPRGQGATKAPGGPAGGRHMCARVRGSRSPERPPAAASGARRRQNTTSISAWNRGYWDAGLWRALQGRLADQSTRARDALAVGGLHRQDTRAGARTARGRSPRLPHKSSEKISRAPGGALTSRRPDAGTDDPTAP